MRCVCFDDVGMETIGVEDSGLFEAVALLSLFHFPLVYRTVYLGAVYRLHACTGCSTVCSFFYTFIWLLFILFFFAFARFVDSAMGGISFFQSAYWSFTVMSTIGFGDYSPTTVSTEIARARCCFSLYPFWAWLQLT